MKIILDLCIVPVGTGVSLSCYISECQKILSKYQVTTQLHACGTCIEGDWDEVFSAVKSCHQQLHEMGVQRIATTIKLGTRTDKDQNMVDRIASVDNILNKPDQPL